MRRFLRNRVKIRAESLRPTRRAHCQPEEGLILREILALGEQQIAAGRSVTAAEAIRRARTRAKRET